MPRLPSMSRLLTLWTGLRHRLHSDMGDARKRVSDAATGLVIGSARLGDPVAPGTVHGPPAAGFHDPSGRGELEPLVE